MRVGIISDVHGNLAALEEVLRAIDRLHCEQIISLGDAVGYGPQPEECIAAIASHTTVAILGNHDDAVLGRTDPVYFNALAYDALLWTRQNISAAARQKLESYLLTSRRDGFLYLHASARSPQSWEYITSHGDARINFRCFTEQICFIGHSHVPGGFFRDVDGHVAPLLPGRIELREGRRYIINAGSVGQPRDQDPRASFVLLDQQAGLVEFHRVAYDITRTQMLMRASHLPDFLVWRLQVGY